MKNISPIIMCGLLIPKYEITLSVANTKIDPNRKPPATGINAYSPFFPYICDVTANSMAGANSDQNDAAIITPAANPSAISRDFRCVLKRITLFDGGELCFIFVRLSNIYKKELMFIESSESMTVDEKCKQK